MGFLGSMKAKVKETFKEKPCSICGTEVGILSRSSLEDGIICNSCKNKFSPFISAYGFSVEDAKKHLVYREECEKTFEKMRIGKTFDEGKIKIYVDEYQGNFAVSKGDAVPDIFDFSQIKSCALKIVGPKDRAIGIDRALNQCEVKTKDEQGKEISYSPKRYSFTYEFKITLEVVHTWVKKIEFGNKQIDVSISEYPGFSLSTFDPRVDREYYETERYYRELVAYMDLAKNQVLARTAEKINEEEENKAIIISSEMLNANMEKVAFQPSINLNTSINVVAFCPTCGCRLNGARFCPQCGTKI